MVGRELRLRSGVTRETGLGPGAGLRESVPVAAAGEAGPGVDPDGVDESAQTSDGHGRSSSKDRVPRAGESPNQF